MVARKPSRGSFAYLNFFIFAMLTLVLPATSSAARRVNAVGLAVHLLIGYFESWRPLAPHLSVRHQRRRYIRILRGSPHRSKIGAIGYGAVFSAMQSSRDDFCSWVCSSAALRNRQVPLHLAPDAMEGRLQFGPHPYRDDGHGNVAKSRAMPWNAFATAGSSARSARRPPSGAILGCAQWDIVVSSPARRCRSLHDRGT